jgi:hypothetical protein
LSIPNQVLALAAQQMLCTAPLLIAFSAVSERATGRSTDRDDRPGGAVRTDHVG